MMTNWQESDTEQLGWLQINTWRDGTTLGKNIIEPQHLLVLLI